MNKYDSNHKLSEASQNLGKSFQTPKCRKCLCLRESALGIARALEEDRSEAAVRLKRLIASQVEGLKPEYECLGCSECYPAEALNLISEIYPETLSDFKVCASAPEEKRFSWPPFPGDYTILDAGGSIAICTLTDKNLREQIIVQGFRGISIIGTLFTENHGIERMVKNLISKPNLRFLILCGKDSEGHLPGQAILSLSEKGIDPGNRNRILGAQGKRPFLLNVSPAEVERFRIQIQVRNLIGETRLRKIDRAITAALAQSLPPLDKGFQISGVELTRAEAPKTLKLDPAGYFIIFPRRDLQMIECEHYENSGRLTRVLRGKRSEEIYSTIIRLGLVSRLDHSAYLGKELSRAENALWKNLPYVQDQAPGELEETNAEEKTELCECGEKNCK